MQKTIKSARPLSLVLETLENRLVPATLAFEVDSVVKTTPVDVQTFKVQRGVTIETSKVVTNTEYFSGDYSFTSDEDGYGRSVQTRENIVVESESWTRIQYPNGSGTYYSVTVTQDVGSSEGNTLDVSIQGSSSENNHASSYTSYTISTYSSRWDGRGNSTSIVGFSRRYSDTFGGDYENVLTDGSVHDGSHKGGSVQDVSETRIISGFPDGSVRQSMTGSSKIRFDFSSSYGGEYADGSWYAGASKRTDTSVGHSTQQTTLVKGTSTEVSLNYVIGTITLNKSSSMYSAGDGYYQSETVQQNIAEDRQTRRTFIAAPSGATIDIQTSIVNVAGYTKVSTVDIDAYGSVFVGTGVQTFSAKIAVQDISTTNPSGKITFHTHTYVVAPRVATKTSVTGSVAPGGVSLTLRAKDHVLAQYGSPLDQYTQGLSNAIFA